MKVNKENRSWRLGTRCWILGAGYWKGTLALLVGICTVSFSAKAAPFDSLRMETINGKQYIIHQVDPKESLFSIARRYQIPVNELAQENPEAGAGLKIGMELKVPYVPRTKAKIENGNVIHKVGAKETLFSISKLYEVSIDDIKKWNNLSGNALKSGMDLIIKKKSAVEVVKATEKNKLPDAKTLKGTHTVTEKETFYSIAKMYGASIQQLKEWNNLDGTDIKPGQVLFVLPPMSTKETVTTTEQTQVTLNKQTQPVQEVKISETVIGTDEIHEKGMATLLEGTEGNRKYLAQHKSAKPGSIIKVRNTTTNNEVFVRVVSALNSSDDTVVKISKSAYDKLGATDQRFAVEVIRYK
ncbi:MAG TPA: hypothetical protein DGG95_14030 [Cytophagales bacterium]|jgi:LysM repeat protein|nr:hypothetical protein [Cytophagales bacterium]